MKILDTCELLRVSGGSCGCVCICTYKEKKASSVNIYGKEEGKLWEDSYTIGCETSATSCHALCKDVYFSNLVRSNCMPSYVRRN